MTLTSSATSGVWRKCAQVVTAQGQPLGPQRGLYGGDFCAESMIIRLGRTGEHVGRANNQGTRKGTRTGLGFGKLIVSS